MKFLDCTRPKVAEAWRTGSLLVPTHPSGVSRTILTPAGFGCCRERFGGGLVPSTSGGRLKSIRRCTPRASRRTAVMSSIAITSIFGSDPQSLVRSGMAKFLKCFGGSAGQGDVEGSLADFNQVYKTAPNMRPYLWQRGLSLYYMEQYSEGSKQFRKDVAANPNDSEEAIWAFMCDVQNSGIKTAQEQFLQVGRDPRPVLRAALDCFETGTEPKKILEAAGKEASDGERFYSLLYCGLWHEAYGNPNAAQDYITKSASTKYSKQSGDYMASVPIVHCQQRGWPIL